MHFDEERSLQILRLLGKNPATSFNESLVSGQVKTLLSESDIFFKEDKYGNIIAEVPGVGTTDDDHSIAFVAHMDHPGLEVTDVRDDGLVIATAMGGIPNAVFNQETDGFTFDAEGNRNPCLIRPYEGAIDRTVSVVGESSFDVGAPITFDLEDFFVDEGIINMRALDDLAGCAAIITVLLELKKKPSGNNVYGIFTRAEEVGLIGARLLALEKAVSLNTFVVSIETSSVIPGVQQGMGPVIRTGDASYTFNAEAEQILIFARNSILKNDDSFKCQRQLMSAGSCEASAFAANGYKTTGIAFPLINWHNATTFIGDPDGDVGLEKISLGDYLGGIRLMMMATHCLVQSGNSVLIDRYRDVRNEDRVRLSVSS